MHSTRARDGTRDDTYVLDRVHTEFRQYLVSGIRVWPPKVSNNSSLTPFYYALPFVGRLTRRQIPRERLRRKQFSWVILGPRASETIPILKGA